MAGTNQHARANRLARTIASDILIYNEEKIEKGLMDDNLFEVLASELAEGEKLFKQSVSSEIAENSNLFECAIVDIIIASRSQVKSKIF
jgi:hypothetical protein